MPDVVETSQQQVARFQPPRLPFHPAIEERFGVTAAEWKALVEAVFPAAQSVDAVVLALSYCKARKLDPFKRVVHIVPIWDRVKKKMTDTVWPGIGELRTTAFRTRQYAGADACEFGPKIKKTFSSAGDGDRPSQNVTLEFPEWAQLTVYRLIDGQRVAIPGPRVYWLETYATASRNSEVPNDMWKRRTVGQLEKCAEAAALRRAFPEELGDESTNDEVAAIGPDNARDITPRPTREDAPQEEAADPFEICDAHGEILKFIKAGEAADKFVALMTAAVTAGADAFKALMESNTLADQLRAQGYADLADHLGEAYDEAVNVLERKAAEAAKSAETAKTDAPAPQTQGPAAAVSPTQADTAAAPQPQAEQAWKPTPSPKSPLGKGADKGDWPTWVKWFAETLRAMPKDQVDGFLKANAKEYDFIVHNRSGDHQMVDAILDDRRAA